MLLSMVMFSFVSLLYRRPSMVPSISSSAVSMLTTSLAFLPTSRSFLQSYSRIHTNAKLLALKAVSREAEVAEEAMIVGMVSEEFKQLVKGYKSNKAPKKLYAEVLKMAENHAMDRNMTVFAIRNLQRMDRYDLALELVPVWENLASNTSLNTGDLLMALPLLKFCCKEGRMDLAVSIASKFQVYPAYSEEAMTSSPLKDAKSFILPELAHGFVSARAFSKCITVLHHMQASSVSIPAETGKHILKSFLKGESSNQIRAALRYISTMGVDNLSTEVDYIQILCSNYLRTLEFMKGAVSIDTLPPEKCPEVCFIGRSNVRKCFHLNLH